MFESVSVFWSTWFQLMSVHQIVCYTYIEIIEFRGLGEFSLNYLSVCWYFISYERIVKDLEI